jgi:hypothetical protein
LGSSTHNKIIIIPFDLNSEKKLGKKYKRRPAKKESSSITEKMELLYKKILDDLLINQEKLTKTERVNLSNYIFLKKVSKKQVHF